MLAQKENVRANVASMVGIGAERDKRIDFVQQREQALGVPQVFCVNLHCDAAVASCAKNRFEPLDRECAELGEYGATWVPYNRYVRVISQPAQRTNFELDCVIDSKL